MWGKTKLSKRIIGLAVILQLLFVMTSEARTPVSSVALFPSAKCNASRALPILRQRLDGKDLKTEWDGDFPWPEVLGIWTRADRDAYAVVGASEVPAGKWGRVKVTIKSICTDETLAQGAKIITNSDWNQESLVVKLRNYDLNGSKLSAVIKTPKHQVCSLRTGDREKIQVQIVQETYNSEGRAFYILRDEFTAERL